MTVSNAQLGLTGRIAAIVAAMWAGLLLCIAAIAAPAAFAVLARPDAGIFVGRVFAAEAYVSIVLSMVLFVVERQRSAREAAAGAGSVFGTNMLVILGTLFCTVAGYFAVQPMMAAARAGDGSISFGALHAISSGFFVLKGVLVIVLAWRLAGRADIRAAETTS